MYSFNVVVLLFILSSPICVIYTQDGYHQLPDQNSVCLCENDPYVINVPKLLNVSLGGEVRLVHSNVDKINQIRECNGIAAADLETFQLKIEKKFQDATEVIRSNISSEIASNRKEMISRLNTLGDLQSGDKQNMEKLKEKIEVVHDVLEEIKDAIRDTRNNISAEMTGVNACGDIQLQIMEKYKESIGKQLKDAIKEIRSNVSAEIASVKNNNADLNNSGVTKTVDTSVIPESCKEVYGRGNTVTGVYQIQPKSMTNSIRVFCDMETRGGGWTVIQNRFDGSQSFDLSWLEYKVGFGDINREFWLGLENIYQMTKNGKNELLVEVVNHDGFQRSAWYAEFGIGPENTRYTLATLQGYDGAYGDYISFQVGAKFTINSERPNNYYRGGWWITSMTSSNFNGLYSTVGSEGMYWDGPGAWNSLVKTRMLVRPA